MSDAKLGVIHYNFPNYTMEDFVSYAQDTGFGYVELQLGSIWHDNEPVSEGVRKAEEVRGLLDAHSIAVSALAAGNDFVVLEPGEVEAQVNRMRTVCDLAEVLGTNLIRTEGGRPKDSVPEDRWVEAMAGCLTACLGFVEDRGIYLAVDNHGLVTNDGDRQVELFERVGSSNVGANLDTMNYRWFGHELEEVYRFWGMVAPYALHTHMKDGFGSRSDYVCMPLGEGELDLERAIKALKGVNYDGVYCVEYEGKEDPAIGYGKGLEYLRSRL